MIENIRIVVDRINELGSRFGFPVPAPYLGSHELSFEEALEEEIEKASRPEARIDESVKKVSAPPDLSPDFSSYIKKYASRWGLSEELVGAIIKAESNYNPRSVSSKGALGLMQLMPETATEMGVTDPFDPEENIMGGTRYLSLLLNRFGGDLKSALAAYNAGPSVVERYKGLPPFRETEDYVARVLSLYSSWDK